MSRARLLGILLVATLAVAFILIGTSYLRQLNKQTELKARLTNVSQTLSLLPVPASDLAQSLKDARQANKAAREYVLPGNVNSTQIIKDILAVADEYHVKVLPISTERWTDTNVSWGEYRVLNMSLETESSFDNLMMFVQRIDSDEFPALIIENFSISRNVEQEGGATVMAVIDLTLSAGL